MKTFLMGVAAVLLACQSPASAWSKKEPFQLKIFQGFRFANESVVKSESGDLSFTYQVRRFGMISYLSAKRIQYFEKAPEVASLRASEIAGWKDTWLDRAPGSTWSGPETANTICFTCRSSRTRERLHPTG